MAHLIFAYGSNLNTEDLERYTRERSLAFVHPQKLCNAYAKDWRTTWTAFSKVRNSGVLNLMHKDNSEVWGTIFNLTDDELVILDRKEGHPKHYRRIPIIVYDANGYEYSVETYVKDCNKEEEFFYPSSNYLTIVIEGMREQGLPEKYIASFIRRSPVVDLKLEGKCMKKTAIYSGIGVGGSTLYYWQELFRNHDIGRLDMLGSHLFTCERLSDYDLIIIPGGGGKKICNGLGESGKDSVRHYLCTGGCLLGVCAGAFATTHQICNYMGISPLVVQDFKHTRRGEALLNLDFTERGRRFFGIESDSSIPVIYHNGPVVEYSEWENCCDYEVLSVFKEEICHPEGCQGIMCNSPAVWFNHYGNGTVVGISPHIERTEGQQHLMANLIHNLQQHRIIIP